jgi:hypothetical protein
VGIGRSLLARDGSETATCCRAWLLVAGGARRLRVVVVAVVNGVCQWWGRCRRLRTLVVVREC